MEIKQIYLFGRYGKILQQLDRAPDFPLIEIDNDFAVMSNQFSFELIFPLTFTSLADKFCDAYKYWGRFGYLGDIIAIKEIRDGVKHLYVLDFIGRLAIIKPGLAVDLVPIIKTKYKNYFVGVKRRYEPGKGLPAFMGGFIDVRGYHLDTPLETVLHEAKEEIGLEINVLKKSDLSDPLPDKVAVSIEYEGREFSGLLILAGIIPTGDNEKMPSIGLKRVYQTTIYSLFLDVSSSDLNEEKLHDWLKAGDDAAELFIADINGEEKINFGLDHHQKAFETILGNLYAK